MEKKPAVVLGKRRPGRKPILSGELLEKAAQIASDESVSLEEVVKQIEEDLDVSISVWTLRRALKRLRKESAA